MKQIKIYITASCFLLSAFSFINATAQLKVGNTSTAINTNSVVEIESTNKGLLLPRIALTATNAAAPLAAHVAGVTVYNTATAGTAPFEVLPGYYYNDGNSWLRIESEIKAEGIINNVAVGTTININGEYTARLDATGFELHITAIGTAKNTRWATADNSSAGAGSTVGTASVAVGTYRLISNNNWTVGQRANALVINLDNDNTYKINAIYYGSSAGTIWWEKIN